MKINHRDLDKKIFIIAEIGNNHEGSFALARQMVAQAAECGVDAVKLQLIVPERLVASSAKERLQQLRKFRLTEDEFKKLSDEARRSGLEFLTTPFDVDGVQFLDRIVPAFKVASCDNTFYPLLDRIAATKKPILLSTGLADEAELSAVVEYIRSTWAKMDFEGSLALLHCVSNYPVLDEEANLRGIGYLRKRFPGLTIGYSDHTLGVESAILAVALGARIIEKHFTLDKNYSDYRDHKLSADPQEMKHLVQMIRRSEILLGEEHKKLSASELKMKTDIRRSVALKNGKRAGAIISVEDIIWVRPGNGIPPGKEDKIIGRRLKRQVKAGELLQFDDLEE